MKNKRHNSDINSLKHKDLKNVQIFLSFSKILHIKVRNAVA